MTTHKGYDFGGVEFIVDPTLTIVDVQDIAPDDETDVRRHTGHKDPIQLIKQDLRFDFTHLDPVMFIYCGRMLRYLQGAYDDDDNTGYMLGQEVDPEVFQLFARRLKEIVLSSGIVIFMDHLPLIEMVVGPLLKEPRFGGSEWSQIGCEMVNGADPDDPTYMSEWRVVVQRIA